MNIKKYLRQTAVYWANPVPNGFGGFTYDPPVEIPVRWEDKQQNIVDQLGEDHKSQAVVFLDQDVIVGEYLMLGVLDDLDSTQDPQKQTGALRIISYAKMPNVSGRVFLRKVWL